MLVPATITSLFLSAFCVAVLTACASGDPREVPPPAVAPSSQDEDGADGNQPTPVAPPEPAEPPSPTARAATTPTPSTTTGPAATPAATRSTVPTPATSPTSSPSTSTPAATAPPAVEHETTPTPLPEPPATGTPSPSQGSLTRQSVPQQEGSGEGGGSVRPTWNEAGPIYTWRDGDRIQRARLVNNLVVQPSAANDAGDVVVSRGTAESIVERRDGHDASTTQPVFISQSGNLMTLPGGVLLRLDPDWDAARVAKFFVEHGVPRSRVTEAAWSPNAFVIETAPGFPSLELAIELAEQEGVLASSPNWQRTAVTR